MRSCLFLLVLAMATAGCMSGPDYSRRLLNEPLKDYYYKDGRNPVQNDPVFTETWDIDGA